MRTFKISNGLSFVASCCVVGLLLGCGEDMRNVAYYKNNVAVLAETVAAKDCSEILPKMMFGGYKNSKESVSNRAINCFYASKALELLPRSQQQEATLRIVEIRAQREKK